MSRLRAIKTPKMLPRRKHSDCDPVCDECQDWLDALESALEPVVTEGLKAYWNVILAYSPELALTEPSESDLEELRLRAREAVLFGVADMLPLAAKKKEAKECHEKEKTAPLLLPAS